MYLPTDLIFLIRSPKPSFTKSEHELMRCTRFPEDFDAESRKSMGFSVQIELLANFGHHKRSLTQ